MGSFCLDLCVLIVLLLQSFQGKMLVCVCKVATNEIGYFNIL